MVASSETMGTPRGKLREALDYVLWAYTPFRPMTARGLYELVSTNAFTARGLYLNLGYWKDAAHHRPGLRGTGRPGRRNRCDRTRRRGGGRGLRLRRPGHPVDEPLRAAPHHRTERHALAGPARPRPRGPARPGGPDRPAGRLRHRDATARCLLRRGHRRGMRLPFRHPRTLPRRGIPRAAAGRAPGAGRRDPQRPRSTPAPPPPARRELGRLRAEIRHPAGQRRPAATATPASCRRPGSTDLRVTSIRDLVFPGWHRALADDPALLRRFHLAGRLPYRLLLRLDANTVYSAFDYVLAAARKPL